MAVGVFIGVVLVLVMLMVACLVGKELLWIEGGGRRADAIVLLGGHLQQRVPRAAELFLAGAAPCVLVSDDDPPGCVCRLLTAAGVPPTAVFFENRSRNTRENAEYSVRWLKEHKARRAIIVTSWFHSRRALACFQHFGPGLEFSSFPAYHGTGITPMPPRRDVLVVLREYPALVWYYARYGVSPWSVRLKYDAESRAE